MESTSLKKLKSTIKMLETKPIKEFSGNKFNVTQVYLENGDSPDFWSTGKFPFKKGNVIEYTLEERYNKGKLSYPHPKFPENMANKQEDSKPVSSASSQMSQQESIARSVGFNNASHLVLTEEFQKHNIDKDDKGQEVMMSKRQIKMLDQVVISANVIYKQLLIKPQ